MKRLAVLLTLFVIACSSGIPMVQMSTALRGIISGTVVDDSGSFLPGVTVSILTPEQTTIERITDAQGSFASSGSHPVPIK